MIGEESLQQGGEAQRAETSAQHEGGTAGAAGPGVETQLDHPWLHADGSLARPAATQGSPLSLRHSLEHVDGRRCLLPSLKSVVILGDLLKGGAGETRVKGQPCGSVEHACTHARTHTRTCALNGAGALAITVHMHRHTPSMRACTRTNTRAGSHGRARQPRARRTEYWYVCVLRPHRE